MARKKPKKQPSPDFVRQIKEGVGAVIIAASHLDHQVGMLIADVLKVRKIHYGPLIVQMSISSKCALLNQIGKEYLNKQDLKDLKDATKEVERVSALRNELAHGFYGVKRGKFALITHSGDAKFSGQPTTWEPSDLASLVDRLERACASVQYARRLFPKNLPLPKKRPSASASERVKASNTS